MLNAKEERELHKVPPYNFMKFRHILSSKPELNTVRYKGLPKVIGSYCMNFIAGLSEV